MREYTPAENVAEKLSDFIAGEVEGWLGFARDDIVWDEQQSQDDGMLPWVVQDREGRRFEVEWDVTVVELTPEVIARRAREEAHVKKLLAEYAKQEAPSSAEA